MPTKGLYNQKSGPNMGKARKGLCESVEWQSISWFRRLWLRLNVLEADNDSHDNGW